MLEEIIVLLKLANLLVFLLNCILPGELSWPVALKLFLLLAITVQNVKLCKVKMSGIDILVYHADFKIRIEFVQVVSSFLIFFFLLILVKNIVKILSGLRQ